MAKRAPDLEQMIAAAARPTSRRPAPPRGAGTSSRTRTVGITIHVDPEIRIQLKMLAAERGTSVHSLVCAGLNAVFAQHHKPEIAR